MPPYQQSHNKESVYSMDIFTSVPSGEKFSSRLIIVTPDMARTWLINYRYPRKRPTRDWHVDDLANKMRLGRLHLSTLNFARYKDLKYLLNGYHRLEAVCKFGAGVEFIVEVREVEKAEELDSTYVIFDRGLPLQYTDVLRATGFAERYGVGVELMERLHAAMPLVISGFTDDGRRPTTLIGKLKRDTEALEQFMVDWLDYAETYIACLVGSESRNKYMFYRAAVMSVGIVTMRYLPQKAPAFWNKACHMTNFADGDVEKTLSIWLRDTSVVGISPMQYARYVASAWNGRFDEKGEGKTTMRSRLVARSSQNPFVLHGTPFKGMQDLWFISAEEKPLSEPIAVPTRRKRGYVGDLLEEMETAKAV